MSTCSYYSIQWAFPAILNRCLTYEDRTKNIDAMKEIDYWLYSIWTVCGSMMLIAWIVHWIHVMYYIPRWKFYIKLISLSDHTTYKVTRGPTPIVRTTYLILLLLLETIILIDCSVKHQNLRRVSSVSSSWRSKTRHSLRFQPWMINILQYRSPGG